MSARVVAAAVVALAVVGCGVGEGPDAVRTPEEGRAGLQASGTVDGRQLAVNDGAPRLVVGNCEPARGPSEDVCLISQDLGGRTVVLAIKNPGALTEGESLEVADAECEQPPACDEVAGVAVVDFQVAQERERAEGGRLDLDRVEEGERYVGSFRLELSDGRVNGSFDVVPRPE